MYHPVEVLELARTAARRTWQVPLGFDRRKTLAAGAIRNMLRAAQEPLEQQRLLRGAVTAVHQAGRVAGIPAPAEVAALSSPTVGISLQADIDEDRLVDAIAVGQAWAQLSHLHQTALAAYARHGSMARAANALGLSHATFTSRLGDARFQFHRNWAEGG